MTRTCEFHQSVADRICEEVAGGKSLKKVCSGADMPCMTTVYAWIRARPEFHQQYADACDARVESLLCDVIDISDNEGGDVARDTLRVKSRQWIIPLLAPKKYGNKIAVAAELSGPGGGPVEIKDTTPIEAARLIGRVLTQAVREAAKTEDSNPPEGTDHETEKAE